MFELRAKMITVGLLGAAVILPLDLAMASQVGQASWYALHSRTASGEMMNPSELTAAHRSLPFGTKVLVENLNNGRTVVVRINDRGPFSGGRIIDLSKAAAASIGMINSGVAKVRVTHSGGGALEALGRETSAAAKTAAAQEKKVEATKPRPAKVTASRGTHKTKIVAAKPLAKTKQAAKIPARKAASVKKSYVRLTTSKRMQVAVKNGVGKPAVRAHYNPYAILGGTPLHETGRQACW
ncbi:MAG: septal ring lytic transglycosylase RlpA family protein [Alphaproteobacteria bacterium]|nr:septal ring lytic transglycosylase RlpA family protein [Alphaproteobacteria bacterium]